jgi:hypothetical protein
VPVPGGEMTGYLRIQPQPQGAYVEAYQIVDTPAQAEFMGGARGLVLGRLPGRGRPRLRPERAPAIPACPA